MKEEIVGSSGQFLAAGETMVLQRGPAQNLVQNLMPDGLGKRVECVEETLSGSNHDSSLYFFD